MGLRKNENTRRVEKKNRKEPAYLTTRILVSAARAGINHAAKETMDIMGYTIVAVDGWVVKRFEDGSEEKLSEIQLEKRPKNIVLK